MKHKPLSSPFEDTAPYRWWHRAAYIVTGSVIAIASVQIVAEVFFN